jgi:cytochrome c-type biogenesis protein CcmH/NrfF
LRASLQRCNLKLLAAFLLSFVCILAQDPTSLLTPGVMRVGAKLACRCGSCRNTVQDCPMLRCGYTEPMRQRIKGMQEQGATDQNIIETIVREQGVVALSAPPAEGWGLFTWVMPGIALLIGFGIYSAWVKRNHQEPKEEINAADRDILARFGDQIESELGDEDAARLDDKGRTGTKK